MKCNRLLFRLAASMPRINGKESVLWPTLLASGMAAGRQQLRKMLRKGMISEKEYRGLIQGNGGKINPELAEWMMGYTRAFTKLLPTPTASCFRGAPARRFVGGGVLHDEPSRIVGIHSPWDNWPHEPELDRVVDGIPDRMDRVKSLGNAVVPQQFYIFFKLIADIEEGKRNDEKLEADSERQAVKDGSGELQQK